MINSGLSFFLSIAKIRSLCIGIFNAFFHTIRVYVVVYLFLEFLFDEFRQETEIQKLIESICYME